MKYSSLLFTPLLFVFCAGVFAACSAPRPMKGCDDPGPLLLRGQETGVDFCTNGPRHRVRAQACPVFEASTECQLDPTNILSCETNADCGKFGIHNVCTGPADKTDCTCQATCVTDNECGPGKFCSCNDPFSFCRTALCRSDADCDDGHMCISSDFGDPTILASPARASSTNVSSTTTARTRIAVFSIKRRATASARDSSPNELPTARRSYHFITRSRASPEGAAPTARGAQLTSSPSASSR